jgi:hypothetical protein
MDTENTSLSFEQKVDAIRRKIDNYFASKALTFMPPDSEIDDIFSLSHDVLSKLPHKIVGEYAFILAKYATYLNKELNKEKSTLNWVKRALDFIVLPKMNELRDGRFITADELKMVAIKDNDLATKIYACLLDIETNVLAIDGLSRDIIKMSDRLSDLQRTKYYGSSQS